jgi:hypothetical protein
MPGAYPPHLGLTREPEGQMLRRMAVAAVELVRPQPDWEAALTRALDRPQGVRERRERPAEPAPTGDGTPRRRIADELAWLREVVDDPDAHDFACEAGAAHLWWPVGDADTPETLERLERLRVRGVLDAAGFLLHDETLVE